MSSIRIINIPIANPVGEKLIQAEISSNLKGLDFMNFIMQLNAMI